MNYRHAFHAGNFADVVKHAVLVRLLVHLGAKPAAYRVIDTHAGAGLYDLTGPEAGRSGEWHGGIERLVGARVNGDLAALLAPYLDAVAACNPPGRLTAYPGSPALVRAFLRPQDRLVACELEPNAALALGAQFRRRPPHQGDRDRRLDRAQRLCAAEGTPRPGADRSAVRGRRTNFPAWRKASRPPTANGRAAPICCGTRSRRASSRTRWRAACNAPASPKILRAEFGVGPPAAPGGLERCGLIVVNPPWTLEGELRTVLPALAAILSASERGTARIDWISAER